MKNADIGEVLKLGKSLRSASFTFAYLPIAKGVEKPAFVAGKKIFKTAVLRNRVRRKMRAALQPHIKNMSGKYKILFNMNNQVIESSVKELKEEIGNVLKKSGMLK